MKLAELQPEVEYAQIFGRYTSADKVKFTADALKEGPTKVRGHKGQVLAQVWKMNWSREWEWRPAHIPLNQIKKTWAEYEIEKAMEEKRWEEERARNLIIRKENEAKQDALWDFIHKNNERMRAVSLITENQYLSPYNCRGGTIEISFNKESLEYLINKLEN